MTRLPTIQTAVETAGTKLLKALLAEIQTQQKLWHSMPQAQQQTVIDRLAMAVDMTISALAVDVVSLNFPRFQASLDSITVKDGIKANLSMPQHLPEVDALVERVGGQVVIVLLNLEDLVGGMNQVRATPDEPELPWLEAGAGNPDDPDGGPPNIEAAPAPPVDNAHVEEGCEQFTESEKAAVSKLIPDAKFSTTDREVTQDFL